MACLGILAGSLAAQPAPGAFERNFCFIGESGARALTAREIEIWARNHNLLLVPAAPLRNLRDYEAEVLPPHGLDFTLDAPGDGRVYL